VILVVDNYDSFTFNLVQALQAAGADVRVVRNDAIDRAGIEALADDPAAHLRGIVVSPGPGDPRDAGVSVDAIRVAADRGIPTLGVCLGMQSMGAAFGASIVRAPTLVHGEASPIDHDGRGLLAGLSPGFMAARYHSLAVDPATLPPDLVVTATAEDGSVLMGMRHRTLPLEGVQFHPESVLTPEGPHLLANFLRLAGEGEAGVLDAATGTFATRGLTDPAAPEEPGPHEAPAPAPARVAPPAAAEPPDPSAAAAAIHDALHRVVDGDTLSFDEARAAMGAVMDGAATPSQLAALLVALRMRGETVDELAGFAAAMRDRVVRVDAPPGTVDTCGTGGDRSGTFNISTAAALVVAAAGVPVAKHGNRAITSRSGSTDVLDALGVRIDHDAASAAAALRSDGFAFLFAPSFHPAMRHAGPTRREIGVRTAFNLLGPLTNPAGARRQVIGVGAPDAAPRLAAVVGRLGTDRTLLVHGSGIDEIPLDGSGVLYDVTPAGAERRQVDAIALADLGIAPAATADLAGGSPEENAAIVEAVLGGAPGPRRDVVLLNAAAALVAAGRVPDLAAGVAVAAETIDAGRAIALLARLRAARRAHEATVAPAGAAEAAPAADAAPSSPLAALPAPAPASAAPASAGPPAPTSNGAPR
jgi:anthranilate synthase/phosphoribosyltransferase